MPTPSRRIGLDALASLLSDASARRLVAIAGAPGSGKSTVADLLLARLAASGTPASILPMDGFHFDDAVLQGRGLLARKGAPSTFDVGGLRHALLRLRANEEDAVAVPVFDRALEISRASARLVPSTTRIVLVEGNYLLLDVPPWDVLRDAFDVTVMVTASDAVLRERLIARWRFYGLSPEQIDAKVEANDLPNGRHVVAASRPADHVIEN